MPTPDNFANWLFRQGHQPVQAGRRGRASRHDGGHQDLLGGLWRFDCDQRLQQLQHGQRLHAEIHRLHDHAGDRLDSSKFYTTASTCKIAGSANPVTKLPDVFKAITTSLTKPRLITN